MEWTNHRPAFVYDCVLLTANLIRGNWDYSVWIIERKNGYWNWLTGDGEEYGDIEDLRADRYCILKEPSKQ